MKNKTFQQITRSIWIAWSYVLISIFFLRCGVSVRSFYRFVSTTPHDTLSAGVQRSAFKLQTPQQLPPIPYLEYNQQEIMPNDIRYKLPDRMTDLPSPNMKSPSPNQQYFPNFNPDLPLPDKTVANSINLSGERRNVAYAPSVPEDTSLTGNMFGLTEKRPNYLPEAANGMGAAGGTDGKSLSELQIGGLYQQVKIPGIPSMTLPGMPKDYLTEYPKMMPDSLSNNKQHQNNELKAPTLPLSRLRGPKISETVPYIPIQSSTITSSESSPPNLHLSGMGMTMPNLTSPYLHIPNTHIQQNKGPTLPQISTPAYLTNNQVNTKKSNSHNETDNYTPIVPDIALNAVQMDISPPKELQAVLGLTTSLLGVLSIIGFEQPRDCAKEKLTLISLKECALDVLTETTAAFDALYQSATMNSRVMAGGKIAESALTRMRSLYAEPYGPASLSATGTPLTCLMLASKEATPDRLRWQALSMLTLLTGLPAGVTIDDTPSGGFGHVNLVMPSPSRIYEPDHIIPLLDAGVDPKYLIPGNIYDVEGNDNSINSND